MFHNSIIRRLLPKKCKYVAILFADMATIRLLASNLTGTQTQRCHWSCYIVYTNEICKQLFLKEMYPKLKWTICFEGCIQFHYYYYYYYHCHYFISDDQTQGRVYLYKPVTTKLHPRFLTSLLIVSQSN